MPTIKTCTRCNHLVHNIPIHFVYDGYYYTNLVYVCVNLKCPASGFHTIHRAEKAGRSA
jgi:hypothetical protein